MDGLFFKNAFVVRTGGIGGLAWTLEKEHFRGCGFWDFLFLKHLLSRSNSGLLILSDFWVR